MEAFDVAGAEHSSKKSRQIKEMTGCWVTEPVICHLGDSQAKAGWRGCHLPGIGKPASLCPTF